MVVKLTKDFKHKVYVEALKLYNESVHQYGLCYYINHAIFNSCDLPYIPMQSLSYYTSLIENYCDISPYKHLEVWTEVFSRKPNLLWSDSYWFDFSDDSANIRKSIFIEAIKETE